MICMREVKELLKHDYFCVQNILKKKTNQKTHSASLFHIRQFNPRVVILSTTVDYVLQ